MVGGDVVRADAVVVAVTALGDLEGRAPVTRAGARPGDVVAVGGHSAGGTLALLTPGVVAAFSYGGHTVHPQTGPMPLPVSSTSKRSRVHSPSSDKALAHSVTPPCSVNFTALLSRLIST